MKHLFDPEVVAEVRERIGRVGPDSVPLWGTMNAAQVMAHCSASLQMAKGEIRPARVPMGRLLGWLIKPLALGNDRPMRRNSPTVPELRVQGERDLEKERARLSRSVEEFAAAGPRGCTTYPHPFFGRMSPQEWAVLMYKHVDHHLRQVGA